jgi:hypothetical protein
VNRALTPLENSKVLLPGLSAVSALLAGRRYGREDSNEATGDAIVAGILAQGWRLGKENLRPWRWFEQTGVILLPAGGSTCSWERGKQNTRHFQRVFD